MIEIVLGILAALFFAVTFILNHEMEVDGGSWLWSASLRYFCMLSFFLGIVLLQGQLKLLYNEMKKVPVAWIRWNFIRFVLFYAPLTFAAAYGAGWLVSGTWQFTIVAGVLLAPLFFIRTAHNQKIRQKIPLQSLSISSIILVGIMLIQIPHITTVSVKQVMLGFLPVIVAAFAYPLGNRKMMALCDGRLGTFSRILGMPIASMPAWIIIASYALFTVGLPSPSQIMNSFIVAISFGIIATVLFFIATERVRHHQGKLAAVEATQCAEILFVIIGEMWLLGIPLPSPLALFGLAVIIMGMFLHKLLYDISKKESFFLYRNFLTFFA